MSVKRISSRQLAQSFLFSSFNKTDLITPLLLKLKEDKNLADPILFNPKQNIKIYKLAKSEGTCWGSLGRFQSFHDFIAQTEYIYVAHNNSLKALPLLTAKKLTINYGLYDYEKKKAVPRVFTHENYADVARLLDLNQLTEFCLIPNYDYEPNQPFAEALQRHQSLKSFGLPRYIGPRNFKFLLMNGIATNQSIDSFYYTQIYGDTPVRLMEKMLAKNKHIKSLYMCCEELK